MTSQATNLAMTSAVVGTMGALGGLGTFGLESLVMKSMRKKMAGGPLFHHAIRGFAVGVLVNISIYIISWLLKVPYVVYLTGSIGGGNDMGNCLVSQNTGGAKGYQAADNGTATEWTSGSCFPPDA